MKKIDKPPLWCYKVAKSLITDGTIKTIPDIFLYTSISAFTKDLGWNYNTFRAKLKKPSIFTIGQLMELADLIEIDVMILFRMIVPPSK